MKHTVLLVAALLIVAGQVSGDDETVIAVDGNSTIIIKDDEWEAEGSNWNPNGEDTRGGNGGATDAVFGVGDPVVESKFQVFHGRDASLSLATEHGRGGGARGHARGRGRGNNRKRTLKALRGSGRR